jgi:hypothetical protein
MILSVANLIATRLTTSILPSADALEKDAWSLLGTILLVTSSPGEIRRLLMTTPWTAKAMARTLQASLLLQIKN